MLFANLISSAAEPASIFYIVTGAVGLLFSRFRPTSQKSNSSVFMHFCKKSTREKFNQIALT
jgi:hypothetical protein